MRRLVGVCCAALVMLLGTLPITVGAAAATTIDAPRHTGTTPASDPGRLSHPDRRLAISVSSFTPRVATATTRNIRVSGTVRNIGDRRIENLDVRLQAGDPIHSRSRLVGQLTTPVDPQRATSHFQRFARQLMPGQTARFSVTVPRSALGIDRAGIYPIQLNVNGRPDYGGTARLVALNLLLPMRSSGSGSSGAAAGISMLWPLAGDHPRLVGRAQGKALLSDDGIARALRKSGRLYGLVDAAKRELSGHPELGSALCFAVDPELLDTVNAMASGYRVRNPGGGSHAGSGQNAAIAWLAELRGVTKNRCVLPLPYADADLVALTRAGLPDLATRAAHSHVVGDTLQRARLLSNVVWPAGGTLDTRTLSTLTGDQNGGRLTTVLSDPQALSRSGSGGTVPIDGAADARALPVDSVVSTALGGLPAHGSGGESGPSLSGTLAPGLVPATSVPGVSTQNGLAALLYRASAGSSGRALITPPRRWHAGEAALRAFLDGAAHLFTTGAATPQPLRQLVSGTPQGAPASLDYSQQAAASEIPPAVTTKVVHDNDRVRDLLGAMSRDTARKETPEQVMEPITLGLLRATSTAWRDVTTQRRQRVIDGVTGSLNAITGQVTVRDPGRPISLASDDSRIPVPVSNGLPVDVTVHISLEKAGGLQVQSIPNPTIPAHGGRTLYIPTKVLRAGWLSVDVVLSTPGGRELGTPARLRLRSSAYGTITIIVTGTAFGLLVLLAGRRIYRRVRAARTRQDGHTVTGQEDDSGADAAERGSGVDVAVQNEARASARDAWPAAPAHSHPGRPDDILGPSRDGR